MRSTRRHINSTGRRRIPRDRVEIRLLDCSSTESLTVSVTIDLDGLKFPDSAAVVLEAYHRSSGMRFSLGDVGSLVERYDLTLDEIDRSGLPIFRLKVIDQKQISGKLLGSAARLRVTGLDEGEHRRRLFPLVTKDLNADVWRVEIDEIDGPRLCLNSRIAGFSHRLREQALVQSLILPMAFKLVLQDFVSRENLENDDVSDWTNDWWSYCADELQCKSDSLTLGDENKDEWIQEAVDRFCRRSEFVQRLKNWTEDE